MSARNKQNKKKTGATRYAEKKASVFKWLLMSLLVGGFTAFLLYLGNIPKQESKLTEITQQEKNKKLSKQKSEDKKSQNKKDKFQFEFYTELPEREVESYVIEEEEPVKKKTAQAKTAPVKTASVKKRRETEKQSPASQQRRQQTEKTVSAVSKPQSNMLYQLQVGAFADWAKADAMKGRLALMGVEPNIQVFHANGRKMYRVRIGPSTDAKKIERIKVQLKAQKINTFMQKLKG